MEFLTPVFQDAAPEHHTVVEAAGGITEEAVRVFSRFFFAFLCISCVVVAPTSDPHF